MPTKKFYKLKPGDNKFRILPPKDESILGVDLRGYFIMEAKELAKKTVIDCNKDIVVYCPLYRLEVEDEFRVNNRLGYFKEAAD